MTTGINLSDGSYVDVRQIVYVKPDIRNWCKVVLESGFEFECQDYGTIKLALNNYQQSLTQK